jgi:hypothetical protein
MYLRDAPLQPLHLSSSPLSSATTFLLGLGILSGIAFVITYWPVFVAGRADWEHWLLMRGDEWRGTLGRYEPAPWWRA